MFLKQLIIEDNNELIRDIPFHKGINLIVDETKTRDRQESGNNVGKTTVLRLIDFCLSGDGENIYKDPEFKGEANTQVERFLKDNNVVITLKLKKNLDDIDSSEIEIKRNFLPYKKKIQEINGEKYNNKEFPKKLKKLIFKSTENKPTLRQIISRNIRDEKNKLIHTIKVLHPSTKYEEYEALYLFWLGINLDVADRKQKLHQQKKIEDNLQKRLKREGNLSQIDQSLLVIIRTIEELEEKKDNLNLNDNYNEDLITLNQIKSNINKQSTELSRLELRRELIIESKTDLDKEFSKIDTHRVKKIYEEAKLLIPDIQKSFEETLSFHNQMIKEKIRYISQELPELEQNIQIIKRKITDLLIQEKNISKKLLKTGAVNELQQLISELNKSYEKKGNLEELKRLWESSLTKSRTIEAELDEINQGITTKDDQIKKQITELNKYFSKVSNHLYGEQFVLHSDKNDRGYELNISSINGNLGTGMKKGQMAAFDLAYIQFADSLDIRCLHFVLQDQIENIHDNQITNLFTEIVNEINCQYVLPVLRDKLPQDIEVDQYEILSLSQSDKLFKI